MIQSGDILAQLFPSWRPKLIGSCNNCDNFHNCQNHHNYLHHEDLSWSAVGMCRWTKAGGLPSPRNIPGELWKKHNEKDNVFDGDDDDHYDEAKRNPGELWRWWRFWSGNLSWWGRRQLDLKISGMIQPGEGIEAECKDRENPKCDPVAHTNHLILYVSDMCAIFICFYIFLIFMQFIFDLGLRIESILSMTQ